MSAEPVAQTEVPVPNTAAPSRRSARIQARHSSSGDEMPTSVAEPEGARSPVGVAGPSPSGVVATWNVLSSSGANSTEDKMESLPSLAEIAGVLDSVGCWSCSSISMAPAWGSTPNEVKIAKMHADLPSTLDSADEKSVGPIDQMEDVTTGESTNAQQPRAAVSEHAGEAAKVRQTVRSRASQLLMARVQQPEVPKPSSTSASTSILSGVGAFAFMAGARQEFGPVAPLQKRGVDGDDRNKRSQRSRLTGIYKLQWAPPLQPRRVGNGDEGQRKRPQLTKKNLAQLQGVISDKSLVPSSVQATAESPSKLKTTPTAGSCFATKAYRNGILRPFRSKAPTNLEAICKRHSQSRGTASPTESEFQQYVGKVETAVNESSMVFEVGGKLLKEYKGKDIAYARAFNEPFTGFPENVGLNAGLSVLQPGFVEGVAMEEYEQFRIDKHVKASVPHKGSIRSLTLPHMTGECKGPGMDMEAATLQDALTGAALVYARNQALSFLGKPDPVGHAAVRTFTTDGCGINFFAHYAAPSQDGGLQYHQYQYASAYLKGTHQQHKNGRRGLRNQQDEAKEQSYALRDQLKEHGKRSCGPSE